VPKPAVYLEPNRSKWEPRGLYQAFRFEADVRNNMPDSRPPRSTLGSKGLRARSNTAGDTKFIRSQSNCFCS